MWGKARGFMGWFLGEGCLEWSWGMSGVSGDFLRMPGGIQYFKYDKLEV